MAATSTSFGNGDWGIGADETGIIIESISHDFSQSSKTLKDRTGNTSGVSFYDEQVKISLNGKLPKTSFFSGTLASSLTLTNPISSYLKGGSTGLVLVEGITVDYNQEDYKSIKINAVRYPNVLS